MELAQLIQHAEYIDESDGEAIFEQRTLRLILLVHFQLLLDAVINVVHDQRRRDQKECFQVMIVWIAEEWLEALDQQLQNVNRTWIRHQFRRYVRPALTLK